MKVAVHLGLLALGGLLAALVLKASGMSLAALLDRSREVKIGFLLLSVAGYGLQSFFVAERWAVLLGSYAELRRLPKGFIYYATNLGLLLTSFVPVFGNIGAKSLVCKLEHDLPVAKTMFAVSLEYLAGFTVIAAMIVPGSLFALHLLPAAAAMAVLVVVSTALLLGFPRIYRFLLSFFRILLSFGERLFGKIGFLKDLAVRVNVLSEGFADLGSRASTRLAGFSLLSYFAGLGRAYLCVLAFGIPIGFFRFSLLFSWGYALSCVGITPGSLGVAEAGWYGVLTYAGIGRENAVFFALGKRVVDIGATLLFAAAAYGYSLFHKRGLLVETPAGRREENPE